MKRIRFPSPSPALLLSIIALVMAAAGTATAAKLLITSKDIKNGTIQLRDLSPKTVKALRAKAARAEFARQAAYAQDAVTAAVLQDQSNPSQSLGASSQPRGGSLLALGRDGHFPISTLPDVAARVYSSTAQRVVQQSAGGPETLVSFDRVSFDTAGLAAPAHPTSLRASVGGLYLITVDVAWQTATPSGTTRVASIRVNGSDVAVDQRSPAPTTWQNVTTIYRLNAGDDVQLGVAQDGSGPTNISAVGDYAPSLAMTLIAQA